MSTLPDFIREILDYLNSQQLPETIDACILVCSGLGSFAAEVRQPVVVPYENISTMPPTSVAGHEGKLIFGMINDKKVLAFSGRFHHYEGFSFEQTATPVYLSKVLGARKRIDRK